MSGDSSMDLPLVAHRALGCALAIEDRNCLKSVSPDKSKQTEISDGPSLNKVSRAKTVT
jgi:hypothetical protein